MKNIGHKRVCKEVYKDIKRMIDGEDGSGCASVVLGLLFENTTAQIKANAEKYHLTVLKPASDKQKQAVYAVLFGRHYSEKAYQELRLFIQRKDYYFMECFGVSPELIKESENENLQPQYAEAI